MLINLLKIIEIAWSVKVLCRILSFSELLEEVLDKFLWNYNFREVI